MWVRFAQDFDFRPTPRTIIAYKAGAELSVTSECARQAIAAGKAVKIRTPNRDGTAAGD